MIAQKEDRTTKLRNSERETGFMPAQRVHRALTAGAEKRLLIWMARRVPASVGPDHLTSLGFAAQVLAGGAYALASMDPRALWLVNFLILLNWLGDSLDGTLARVRNQQRPRYGFYVDHMADTFGALALMAGLASSGYMHWLLAAGMLAGFYVLSIESYLATYTVGRFHLSQSIFGPTEIRILLIAGNVVLTFHPYAHLWGRTFRLFDVGAVVAITGMAIMAVTATVRHTVALYREESLR